MQPYFFPYLGYFRLFAAADVVVLYDCVQFPRRGRVHRSALQAPAGQYRWLTLPLLRQPREVCISDLVFQDNAEAHFHRRLSGHGWFRTAKGPLADDMRARLKITVPSVADYLERQLVGIARQLELPAQILRSSSLKISSAFTGQRRVLAVVEALGGAVYINSPGGRHLYQDELFQSRGIRLRFLAPYTGLFPHALPALMEADQLTLQRDIQEQAILEDP